MDNKEGDLRPLVGLRVFELGTAIAGPMCARYLAHFGAEVIKVESTDNPDTSRTFGSGWLSPEEVGREVWLDTNPAIAENNAGKLGVGLNLKTPEGMAVAKKILGTCDIFVSNLTGRAIKSLGLEYETVRAIKPDIIYIQLTGYGVTPGPYTNYLAWGKNLVALTGVDELTGWPDRAPAGITRIAYPDQSNGLYGIVAVLAALDYRDRTGEGQAIDLSQFEATVALLGPMLLDYENNGRCPERMGNRHSWRAPQGIYPCRGEDRWVAITVFDEDDWWVLCQVAGHPEWVEDPRFATVNQRLANHDELDAVIGEWTSQHANTEVAEWLQQDGVASAPVFDYPNLTLDPQLTARDFWLLTDHARFGPDFVTGNPIHLSETPGHVERSGPALGQDNDYVLKEICGLSQAEIEDLTEKRAVCPMVSPEIKLQRPYVPWLKHFTPNLPWPVD